MMSKTLSAASGTVHKTDTHISYVCLISCSTAYIVYLSINLCSSLLLLVSQGLNDLLDLGLACLYSTFDTAYSHVDQRPEESSGIHNPLYKSQDLSLKGLCCYLLLLQPSLHAFGPVL